MFVKRPGEPGVSLLIVPGLGEDRVQVEHEGIGVQAQFTVPQIAADAATDVIGRWRAMVGVEADTLQVGSKLQALVAFGVRPGL